MSLRDRAQQALKKELEKVRAEDAERIKKEQLKSAQFLEKIFLQYGIESFITKSVKKHGQHKTGIAFAVVDGVKITAKKSFYYFSIEGYESRYSEGAESFLVNLGIFLNDEVIVEENGEKQ